MGEKVDHPVGTPGFYNIGSDTYPITIVQKTARGYVVQYDKFEDDKAAGHDYYGQQKYKFTRNPKGRLEEVTWKPRRSCWGMKGSNSGWVHFGEWRAYQDPSF